MLREFDLNPPTCYYWDDVGFHLILQNIKFENEEHFGDDDERI